jgi:YbbR domain-containing protein
MRNVFLLLFFVFTGFSSFAGNDDIDIDLLKTRDIIVRALRVQDLSTSLSVKRGDALDVEASFNEDEMTIFVDNYYGEVSVQIFGPTSIGESFYPNGGGEFIIDISDLQSGDYQVKIKAGAISYIGKFSIED